jgi:nitrate/TMAO reductase-like tetraheme cytochrome c subunit
MDDQKKGHKGRYGEKCETCHATRDWKAMLFNHDRDTKYPLRGKHAQTKCDSCHTGALYKQKLSTTCFTCHQKDDKHKGQQGRKCESCHNERDWKTTRFDHGLTRFPLLGKHAKVECKDCHKTVQFRDAKTECVACHQKDDTHKRRLGTRCEACHNAVDWKRWDFDHDRRTRFKLDGAHKPLACLACHTKPMSGKVSAPATCAGCHETDDVHDGRFGRQCERCHVTDNFRRIKPAIGAGMR